MASLEKTEVKLENSGGRVCLGFAFSVAAGEFCDGSNLGDLLF